MNKIIIYFIFLFSFFSSAFTASAFDGPLLVRNQFPLFSLANTPYLEAAGLADSFSLSLSHSSIYLVRGSAAWSVGLDMEVTELNLRMKKNIKDFLEVGCELPILSFNSGFMDGFLESYHNAFGFPDYGRSGRPDNRFLYTVKRNGKLVIRGGNGNIGIGDVRLTLKTPVLRGDPALSILGSLELPSGDAQRGYGNGSIDAGLAVCIDKKIGNSLKSYLNFGIISPGDLKSTKTVDLQNYLYGGAAIETAFWKNVSLIGQLFVQGSPFPETGISQIDRTAVLLSFGGRYYSGGNSFELSLTEDPNTAGAPDFTLNISWKQKF